MKGLRGLALLVSIIAGGAHAQDYPARPVTVVVPYAAGGSTDILGRMVSQRLSEKWGKPVVIENRPGAGTATGSNQVAKATPDGYTLLMGSSTPLAINASLHKKLPYDPATDFMTLAVVGEAAFVLLVSPSLPIYSVADLVKYAKDHPNDLTYGSAGVGSPHHLFMEYFKSLTEIELRHVPYRGTAPALTDVIGGQVSMMFCDTAPALEMIKAGKVRPLAISSEERSLSLPDLRTIAEEGVRGYQATAWLAFAAPSRTPAPILQKLHDDITQIANSPEYRDATLKLGIGSRSNPSLDELQTFVRSEIQRWGQIVKASGAAED